MAAETLLLIAGEQPIPLSRSSGNSEAPNFPSNTTLNSTTSTSRPNPSTDHGDVSDRAFMFPHIQGILAFDTPYLGLAPGMVAHSIEGGHKMVSSAYSTFNEISSVLGWGSKSESAAAANAGTSSKPLAALPAPSMDDAAAAPKWQSWGKYAMFAGAAGAVAAGGAAALYSQREKLSVGWSWAGSHLLFVNCLARPEELRRRVARMDEVCTERELGCANFYTNLGSGAREGYGVTASVVGKDRTFCNLPTSISEGRKEGNDSLGLKWYKAVNEKSTDETLAHMSMFFPRDNPGFYNLGERAKEVVVSWIDEGWYDNSAVDLSNDDKGAAYGEIGERWERPDYESADVRRKMSEQGLGVDGDWEGLDGTHEDYDGHDLDMRDEVLDGTEDKENLESSVIVDKAKKEEVLLPIPP